jgi:hypothetical protein
MAPLIDAKQVISKLEQWLNSRAMPAQLQIFELFVR